MTNQQFYITLKYNAMSEIINCILHNCRRNAFIVYALLLTVKVEVYGFTREFVVVRKNNHYWTAKKLNLNTLNYGRSTLAAVATSAEEDPYESFPLFDKVLFKLFSASVTAEMDKKSDEEPKNYSELMSLINEMTLTRSTQRVNDQGKNMLKRLFPPWLLTQYKWMFAAPFPEVLLFSSVSDASADLRLYLASYWIYIAYHRSYQIYFFL
jgi:hypothetical protein